MRYSLWSGMLVTTILTSVPIQRLGEKAPDAEASEYVGPATQVFAEARSRGAAPRRTIGTCHRVCPSCSVAFTWKTSGEAGRGFGYDYESQPCYEEECDELACAPHDEDFDRAWADVTSNDLQRVKSAMLQHKEVFVLNVERHAIQVTSCSGTISGHVQLPKAFAAALATFLSPKRGGTPHTHENERAVGF
jgi:hypothetical protein